MMSVSPGMAAGQAAGYFSREDYYLRESGQDSAWFGRAADSLGLSGAVGEEEFRALCAGTAPGGERLVAPKLTKNAAGELVGTHRAGNDCTFSAPKSVSIAYVSGVEGIKEAHDAAVESVARHLEKHNSFYRSPDGLQHGKLVAARFDHATSRNIDPQLHSHLFVLNIVEAPNGSWLANEPKGFYQGRKLLGLLYRVELARELEARGFGIEIRDRSWMFFELKGVDPLLIKQFSSRREEIERQVAVWKEERRFAEVPEGRLYEMAALETRDPKRSMTREEVAGIFERGFEACGTSSAVVKRELERSPSPSLPEPDGLTPGRAVQLAARDLTAQEAVVRRERLLDQAVRISGTRFSIAELDAAVDAEAEGVLRVGRDRRGREFYTTSAMLELEAANLKKVRELAAVPFSGGVQEHETAAFRERLSSEGIRLTAGQWREFENEVAGKSSFALSVGDPGTAKTGTLHFVERFNREVLQPSGRERCSANLSYTGKAARELGLATGQPGFTIDSFLNAASKFDLQRENSPLPILEVGGEKIFTSKEAPLILRVDEASFLGARQARELIGVVEGLQRRGVQVKLHLLGDTKQMQAIAAGDFLHQVEELGKRGELEYAHLNEILRQRDPGLLEIAKELNREDRPLAENAREALQALDRRGELVEIPAAEELRRAAVRHYLEESAKPSLLPERGDERRSVLMLAGTNEERRELNRAVREARITAREIEEGKSFKVLSPVRQGVTVEGYQPGDRVLFTGVRGEDGKVKSWGARIGTEGEVIGIDRERNLVRLRYGFTTRKDGVEIGRTVTRNFSAEELVGKSALYREEERKFAAGDRIVLLKNDRKLDLQNGAVGTILELDQEGRALVDLGGRKVELDLTRYRHLDHAYAVTVHKSQGGTVEHSIMVAVVRAEPEQGVERKVEQTSYGRASYNTLNVAVTRAQFGTRVFTNSVEALTKSVQMVEKKSSTLDHGRALTREVGHDIPGQGPDSQLPSGELAQKIRRLNRALHEPSQRLSLEGIRVTAAPRKTPELSQRALQVRAPLQPAARTPELALSRKLGLERERGK